MKKASSIWNIIADRVAKQLEEKKVGRRWEFLGVDADGHPHWKDIQHDLRAARNKYERPHQGKQEMERRRARDY